MNASTRLVARWPGQAACRGMYDTPPPGIPNFYDRGKDRLELFFDYGHDTRKIAAAKRICAGCPVRLECLRDNINVPYGIFGGLTEEERFVLVSSEATQRQTYRRRVARVYFLSQEKSRSSA